VFRFRHICVLIAVAAAFFVPDAKAQGITGKTRSDAARVMESIASVGGGKIRSGSCLRPIGDIGTEEFAVYLLLPTTFTEGFVVEFSGDDGAVSEIAANAAIASFTEDGDTQVRENLGMEWVAAAYIAASDFIRSREMYEDNSYEEALTHLPTERCPMPAILR
jgi:hypothetical protein